MDRWVSKRRFHVNVLWMVRWSWPVISGKNPYISPAISSHCRSPFSDFAFDPVFDYLMPLSTVTGLLSFVSRIGPCTTDIRSHG